MQIVIDIPEEDYATIMSDKAHQPRSLTNLEWKIANGTPLPKGHGGLKDVDHYRKMQWEHPDYSLMDDEPTIIEADKG